MTTKYGASHERMIRYALRVKPNTAEPAFVVRIVSNYSGYAHLLQWGDVPLPDPKVFPRFKVYGHYAAYPFTIHDGGKLIESVPEVRVKRSLLLEVLETFRSGIIQDEMFKQIQEALDQSDL